MKGQTPDVVSPVRGIQSPVRQDEKLRLYEGKKPQKISGSDGPALWPVSCRLPYRCQKGRQRRLGVSL